MPGAINIVTGFEQFEGNPTREGELMAGKNPGIRVNPTSFKQDGQDMQDKNDKTSNR
jgi:hypothetical protein